MRRRGRSGLLGAVEAEVEVGGLVTEMGMRVERWDGLPVRDADAVGGEEVEVGKVAVPRGHVWVEGDNWRKSFDSCDFGPVSLGLVDGRAVGVWRRWWGFDGVGDGRVREEGHWSRVVEAKERPGYVGDDFV